MPDIWKGMFLCWGGTKRGRLRNTTGETGTCSLGVEDEIVVIRLKE